MVDQQQRPDIPQDLTSLPGRSLHCPDPYLDLMQQCWSTDPTQRPSFERIISHLRCGTTLLPFSEAVCASLFIRHPCLTGACGVYQCSLPDLTVRCCLRIAARHRSTL